MLAEIKGLSGFSVIEQGHTCLRPRHGADFGPQIVITEDRKRYVKHHNIGLIGYQILLMGAYTTEDKPIPAQYADGNSRYGRKSRREAGVVAVSTST